MEENQISESMRAGVWNGNEFVFTESSWRIATVFKLLYRYGIQPIKLYRYSSVFIHSQSELKKFSVFYLQIIGDDYGFQKESLQFSVLNSIYIFV